MPIIQSSAALKAQCALWRTEPFIAVDTEFVRERTYYPQLCLVQVRGKDATALIDPLLPELDLTPLAELLADKNVIKVFHSCRQDMEVVQYAMNVLPNPVFDTQIAAMFCGLGDGIGYAALVKELLGVTLDKSQQYVDWSRRPLTDAQRSYGEKEVRYLHQIYGILTEKLTALGRLTWCEEELALLQNPAIYRTEPENAWQRLRPQTKEPKFIAVLQALSAWRETEAMLRNVPRGRILKDDALFELTKFRPRTERDLAKLASIPKSIPQTDKDSVLGLLELTLAQPFPPSPPATPELGYIRSGQALADILKVLLKIRAEQHTLSPRLIATTEELEQFARGTGESDVSFLAGWRYEMFGREAIMMKEHFRRQRESGEMDFLGSLKIT